MKKALIKIVAYTAGYLLIPLALTELTAELALRNQVDSSSYTFAWVLGLIGDNPNHIKQLNRPFLKQIHTYNSLYPGSNRFNPVIFETDSYGSSLENSLGLHQDKPGKVLFCGGSSSESASVPKEYRPVFVASMQGGKSIEQLPFINLSKSGNTLLDCINILNSTQIKGHRIRPSKIVIATNVNTIGAASVALASGIQDLDQAKEVILDKYHSSKVSERIKRVFERLLPGIAEVYRRRFKGEFQGDGNSSYRHPHEVALESGCCHIAALVNNRKGLSWDWASERSIELWDALVQKYWLQLSSVAEELAVDKKSVYIYIEPNSFGMKRSNKLNTIYTENQELRSIDGIRYGGDDSHRLTEIYDDIYAKRAAEAGFTIIKPPYERLTSAHFFDAVHLTPLGGKVIGEYLYRRIGIDASQKRS